MPKYDNQRLSTRKQTQTSRKVGRQVYATGRGEGAAQPTQAEALQVALGLESLGNAVAQVQAKQQQQKDAMERRRTSLRALRKGDEIGRAAREAYKNSFNPETDDYEQFITGFAQEHLDAIQDPDEWDGFLRGFNKHETSMRNEVQQFKAEEESHEINADIGAAFSDAFDSFEGRGIEDQRGLYDKTVSHIKEIYPHLSHKDISDIAVKMATDRTAEGGVDLTVIFNIGGTDGTEPLSKHASYQDTILKARDKNTNANLKELNMQYIDYAASYNNKVDAGQFTEADIKDIVNGNHSKRYTNDNLISMLRKSRGVAARNLKDSLEDSTPITRDNYTGSSNQKKRLNSAYEEAIQSEQPPHAIANMFKTIGVVPPLHVNRLTNYLNSTFEGELPEDFSNLMEMERNFQKISGTSGYPKLSAENKTKYDIYSYMVEDMHKTPEEAYQSVREYNSLSPMAKEEKYSANKAAIKQASLEVTDDLQWFGSSNNANQIRTRIERGASVFMSFGMEAEDALTKSSEIVRANFIDLDGVSYEVGNIGIDSKYEDFQREYLNANATELGLEDADDYVLLPVSGLSGDAILINKETGMPTKHGRFNYTKAFKHWKHENNDSVNPSELEQERWNDMIDTTSEYGYLDEFSKFKNDNNLFTDGTKIREDKQKAFEWYKANVKPKTYSEQIKSFLEGRINKGFHLMRDIVTD